ncbi:MAG: YabP/YqfC family sporulation protein [Clostridia bacterium]|nr:YabP/YqfC family sporulation protein [Clostridia bacterium]
MGKRRRYALLSPLPEDVLCSGARVTMMGRSAVLVEGQRGVVELGTRCIRLRTVHGVLSIQGEGLILQELSADAAMIRGECMNSAGYAGQEGHACM